LVEVLCLEKKKKGKRRRQRCVGCLASKQSG